MMTFTLAFVDQAHQARFTDALGALPAGERPTRAWQALLYLLSGDAGLWEKALPYLHLADKEFWWADMTYRQGLTEQEDVLRRLGVDLWTGDAWAHAAELTDKLDPAGFDLALLALRVRRG